MAQIFVKFVLQVDGTNKYWNGTAWVTSSGYTQSNTAADILAHAAALAVTSGAVLRFVAYLHSDVGNTTPSLEEVEIIYSFWAGPRPDPKKGTVWGYVLSSDGLPVDGVSILINTVQRTAYGDIIISTLEHTAVTDAYGYWEIELIPSALFTPVTQYRFRFDGPGVVIDETKTVPSGDTNYADL